MNLPADIGWFFASAAVAALLDWLIRPANERNWLGICSVLALILVAAQNFIPSGSFGHTSTAAALLAGLGLSASSKPTSLLVFAAALMGVLMRSSSLEIDLAALTLAGMSGLLFFRKPSELVSHALVPILVAMTSLHLLSVNSQPLVVGPAYSIAIAVCAGLVAALLAFAAKTQDFWARIITGAVAGVAGCYAINQSPSAGLLIPALIGLGVAGLGHLVLSNSQQNSLRFLMVAFLWIGAGTVAFSLHRTPGMAMVLTFGLILAAILGSQSVINAGGGLASLIAIRTFGIDNPQARLTLDVGHHHAVMGLLVGMGVVLILAELGDQETPVAKWRTSMLLGVLIAAVAAFLTPVLTGPRAVTGLMLGAGIGVVVAELAKPGRGHSWTGACAIFATIYFGMNELSKSIDLTRDAKIQWLVAGGVVILALAAALQVLTRPSAPKGETTNVA